MRTSLRTSLTLLLLAGTGFLLAAKLPDLSPAERAAIVGTAVAAPSGLPQRDDARRWWFGD